MNALRSVYPTNFVFDTAKNVQVFDALSANPEEAQQPLTRQSASYDARCSAVV